MGRAGGRQRNGTTADTLALNPPEVSGLNLDKPLSKGWSSIYGAVASARYQVTFFGAPFVTLRHPNVATDAPFLVCIAGHEAPRPRPTGRAAKGDGATTQPTTPSLSAGPTRPMLKRVKLRVRGRSGSCGSTTSLCYSALFLMLPS